MRSSHLLSLLLLVALTLHLASDLVLTSPARSRNCRRALYLSSVTKRGETDEDLFHPSLLPRLWRNSELPVPLGLGRKPPHSTTRSSGSSKHARPPISTISAVLSGNPSPSQAKTRKERKKEVAEKKKAYEELRAGHALVDMIIDECRASMMNDLPPRPKRGRGSGSGSGGEMQPDRSEI